MLKYTLNEEISGTCSVILFSIIKRDLLGHEGSENRKNFAESLLLVTGVKVVEV